MERIEDKMFGEVDQYSKKRFGFDGSKHKDPDVITIITGNVRRFKDDYVLVVDNNKVVFLKGWQIAPIYCNELGMNAFAVKLNRKYFKPYTWKASEFTDFLFEKEDTFDSLAETAKEQAYQSKWKLGHYGGGMQADWLKWE